MSSYRITEVPLPSAAGPAPDWRVRGAADVGAMEAEEVLGNTDLADSAETVAASLANQKNFTKHLFVACREDAPDGVPESVLGVAWVYASVRDNPHLSQIDVSVRPQARGKGLGSALWDTALERARSIGRTVILSSTGHGFEPSADSPNALAAPTGSGRLPRDDPGARFAQKRGFALEQVERHSMLPVPVSPELLARSRAEAELAAGQEYSLVTWADRVPDEWMEQYCVLQTRMSTDAPVAGLDFREEVWDAERVENIHQSLVAAGKGTFVTAALHRATGALAGFTEMETLRDKPEVVYQENTLVLSDHRGHRLGMLVKAANLQLLADHRPHVRRVHTWNAEENSFMLDINVALGFRRASVWGEWQLKL